MKAMRIRVFALVLCIVGFASLSCAQGVPFGGGAFGNHGTTNHLAYVQVCIGAGTISSTAAINIGASSSFCHNGGTAANPQAGDIVKIYVMASTDPGSTTCSDTLGNSCVVTRDATTLQTWATLTVTTGGSADTVNFNFTNAPTVAIISNEISGQNVSPTDCAPVYGTTSSTSWSGPGCTTANANDLILACMGANANITYAAGSGYTVPFGQYDGGVTPSAACEYQIVNSTNTYTPTMTVGTSTAGSASTQAIKSS